MRRYTRKKYREGQYDYRDWYCEDVPLRYSKEGNHIPTWFGTKHPGKFGEEITLGPFYSLGLLERKIDEWEGD